MNVTLKKWDKAYDRDFQLPAGHWTKDADGMVWVRCPHDEHSDKMPRLGVIHRGKDDPKNWNIDAQGNVTPSIFFNDAACGWHVFAKLEGWIP